MRRWPVLPPGPQVQNPGRMESSTLVELSIKHLNQTSNLAKMPFLRILFGPVLLPMRAFFFMLFDSSGEGKPRVAHVIGVGSPNCAYQKRHLRS